MPKNTQRQSSQQKPLRFFITGCSTGIGRALVQACLDAGHQVVATARRLESIQNLAATNVEILPLDVNDAAAIQTALASAGDIDIVINNAGYGAMGPLLDVGMPALQLQFNTNTFAPIAMAQAFAPQMIAQGHGTIVNIGSVSGLLTTPFSGAYCASKAALHSLSDALRMELAPFGIHVVTIQPGAIRSEMGNNAATHVEANMPPDSFYARIRDAVTARALASQTDATSAEKFAADVIEQITADNPPAVYRAGNKSNMIAALSLLPTSITDKMLSKRFSLDHLKPPA